MTHEPDPAQASDLPRGLSAPARRALAGAGLTSLAEVAARPEAAIRQLHGIGPNALKQLRAALAAQGLAFTADPRKVPPA